MSPYDAAMQKIRATNKETLSTPELLDALGSGVKAAVSEMNRDNQSRSDKLQTSIAKHQKALDEAFVRLDLMETNGGGTGSIAPTNREKLLPFAAGFMSNSLRRAVQAHEIDWDQLAEYRAAFASYLRLGPHSMPNSLHAAMQVGSDPDGGYWAPPELAERILSRLFDTSPMRQFASVQTMSTDHIEFPIDPNDAVSGGWVGETDERPETDTPKVGLQSIYAREQFAQPKITQKLLDDAGFDIETWLVNKIVRKLVRQENSAFVHGDGVAKPRGFLSYPVSADDDGSRPWGTLQYVPSGASGGFPAAADFDGLMDLQLSLKSEYLPNAVWAMRRSTAATLRKLKDTVNRSIWLDSLSELGRPILLGHRVVFFEDMPAIAPNSLSIAFGDFSHYGIFDHRVGVRILRDPLTAKGFVKFYTHKRVGGDVLGEGFDAVKLLRMSTN